MAYPFVIDVLFWWSAIVIIRVLSKISFVHVRAPKGECEREDNKTPTNNYKKNKNGGISIWAINSQLSSPKHFSTNVEWIFSWSQVKHYELWRFKLHKLHTFCPRRILVTRLWPIFKRLCACISQEGTKPWAPEIFTKGWRDLRVISLLPLDQSTKSKPVCGTTISIQIIDFVPQQKQWKNFVGPSSVKRRPCSITLNKSWLRFPHQDKKIIHRQILARNKLVL